MKRAIESLGTTAPWDAGDRPLPKVTPRGQYYRQEACRVADLAAITPQGQGRECFERVAEEYRSLADFYDGS